MDANLVAHLIFQKYFNKTFHRIVAPQLNSYSSYLITEDPNVAVMKVTGTDVRTYSSNLKQEFDLLTQILNERYKRTNLKSLILLRQRYQPHIFCIQVSGS